jgi:alkylated DNA repair dioxygenase AlkB
MFHVCEYLMQRCTREYRSTDAYVRRSDWPDLLDFGSEEGKKVIGRSLLIAQQTRIANSIFRFVLAAVISRANAVSLRPHPGSCFAWKAEGCIRVCSFDCAPGLYVMPNALSVSQQQQLALHAYTTLAHPRYDCNLQSTVHLPTTQTLFDHWRDSMHTCCPEFAGEVADYNTAITASRESVRLNTIIQSNLDPLPRDAAAIEQVLRRLRWTVLGYRYDWRLLSYDWGQQPEPLPDCITHLAEDAVELLRQHPIGLQCGVYRPQAAVVNFYQIGDSLTSHVDRSEPAAGAPLVTAPHCTNVLVCLCNSKTYCCMFLGFFESGLPSSVLVWG